MTSGTHEISHLVAEDPVGHDRTASVAANRQRLNPPATTKVGMAHALKWIRPQGVTLWPLVATSTKFVACIRDA